MKIKNNHKEEDEKEIR